MTADDGRLAHNRVIWALVNEQFTDADAAARWEEPDVRWGLFRTPEHELGVLGGDDALRGARVAELGAGTSFLSAALTRAGARTVAVDLSRAQLVTAQRCQRESAVTFPLVEATGEAVPLRGGVFDLVVSEYGASPWCEPVAWLAEAARLLRPGGRLVFLTNSVLAGMCVPDEGGFAGEQLLRTPAELARVTWDGGGTEHHPSHSAWIAMLRAAGFVVDALHELTARPDAPIPDYYDIADVEWATKWPVEDLWVAHLG